MIINIFLLFFLLELTLGDNIRILLVGGAGTTYDANFTIGTPPQDINLRVDTNQGDIYVLDSRVFPTCDSEAETDASNSSSSSSTKSSNSKTSSTSSLSSSETSGSEDDDDDDYECGIYGTYNISESDTSNSLDSTDSSSNDYYEIPYSNTIYVSGHLVEDDYSFIDMNNIDYKISNVTFLNANESTVEVGGLGLASNELGTGFLGSLKENQLIDTDSYSLWLSNITSVYGELLPGFVDSDLFIGDFYQYDMLMKNGDSVPNLPILALTNIEIESKSGDTLEISASNDSYPFPVLLDSRSYYNFIPTEIILQLAVQLNAYYSSDLGRWLVECSVADLNATVNFQFGNLYIKVPVSELLYNAYDLDSNNYLQFSDGDYACYIAFLPSEYSGVTILGTPFLRSAYIAVDNEGKKVGVAQSNHSYTVPDHIHTTTITYSSESSSKASSSKNQTNISNIQSGNIPFATADNTTYSLTLTSSMLASTNTNLQPEQSIYISNGEVYFSTVGSASAAETGKNTTTTTAKSSSGKLGVVGGSIDGIKIGTGWVSLFVIGFIGVFML